ncbi:MAG: YvcK family protein [Candidatus Niyogibacteria bacterium]|nr:YvcK family protein [Candidatus Niyogibacteria bacterium]
MSKEKRIVVIGGGTGTYTVLSALKYGPVYLSAIVSMADDGGSTGILREEFGILPTGDVRRALVALSKHPDELLSQLFNYRFREGGLNGHNFGNLIITALERICGNFEKALTEASRLLAVERGEVIPVTLADVRLFAELEDGSVIRGETNIDIPKHDGELAVNKVWLEPNAKANPKALQAIRRADLVVIGPGDLYTSVIPNILVRGIPEAISQSRAKKIFVCNLMTKYGETHGFVARDFVLALEKYLGEGMLDAVILNNQKPPETVLRRYRKERAFFVDPFLAGFSAPAKLKVVKTNLLRKGEFIRHDHKKLADIILKYA